MYVTTFLIIVLLFWYTKGGEIVKAEEMGVKICRVSIAPLLRRENTYNSRMSDIRY